jgi:DNA-binding transcriptional LysR family regulator
LREGQIDLGFAFHRPSKPEVETIVVGREAVMLALPESHHLARVPSVRLIDLAEVPFLWFPCSLSPLYFDQMAEACAAGGLAMRVTQEVTSETARLNLVAAGIGATWSIASAVSRRPKSVVVRPVEDLDVVVTTQFLWRPDRLGPAGRAFLELVPAD